MKKGILGLGNSSTLFYINEINSQFNKVNGEFSTCPFIFYQVDFAGINPYLPHDFEVLIPKIKIYLDEIERLGIEKLLIPNITLHETVDKISANLKIIHAVDLTIKKLKENNIREVVLFGTVFTMNSNYFSEKFKKENIRIILPDQKDQLFIDDFRKKVYDKTGNSEEIGKFQNLCYLYSIQKALVLACTELSIHNPGSDNIFDMVKIQIEEFLK